MKIVIGNIRPDYKIMIIATIVILFMVLCTHVVDCQNSFELDRRYDACEPYETAYIVGYYDVEIYCWSMVIYYNKWAGTLIGYSVADEVWIVPGSQYFINNDTLSGKWSLSWLNMWNCLPITDTLFALHFRLNIGINLNWSINNGECEIGNFNAVPYPCTFYDGYLKCVTSSIDTVNSKFNINIHKEMYNGKFIIIRDNIKYNILGQKIK